MTIYIYISWDCNVWQKCSFLSITVEMKKTITWQKVNIDNKSIVSLFPLININSKKKTDTENLCIDKCRAQASRSAPTSISWVIDVTFYV